MAKQVERANGIYPFIQFWWGHPVKFSIKLMKKKEEKTQSHDSNAFTRWVAFQTDQLQRAFWVLLCKFKE